MTTWTRSTYCGSGACVEVARTASAVHVRDAKDPAGPALAFGPAAWRAFVADLRTPR